MSNINDPTFVTTYNAELFNNDDVDIAFILNKYALEDKMTYDNTRHNPYQVIESLGISEKFCGPIDVDKPAYVDYVKQLRLNINVLASMIKKTNKAITDCTYNQWYQLPFSPDHNIHKFIVAARHNLVDEYNSLIELRRYWKSMYKVVRDSKKN